MLDINYQANGKDRSREVACQSQEPGLIRVRNGQLLFNPLRSKLRTLRKKKKADPLDPKILKRFKNTRKLFKASKEACANFTDPIPSPPTPTPTPAATPAPTPTPVTVTSYFDQEGNVTDYGKTVFGIPASLEANMLTGMGLWQSYCLGCHEERRRNTFDELRDRISQEPMYYDEINLPDEDLAHIMAWVSRFRFPQEDS